MLLANLSKLINKFHVHAVHVKQTCWNESKLSARYICIDRVPVVITNSAPLVVVADFNSTLTMNCAALESDVTICAHCQT